MIRDYRQGIKGILSLGPTPTKPRIIKSEPDPYGDLFSLDTPVVLTPKETPQIKKEPGKYYKNLKAQKWFTRPTTKTITKAKPKDMPLMTYLDRMNVMYSGQEKRTVDDQGNPLKANKPLNKPKLEGHKYVGALERLTAKPEVDEYGNVEGATDRVRQQDEDRKRLESEKEDRKTKNKGKFR